MNTFSRPGVSVNTFSRPGVSENTVSEPGGIENDTLFYTVDKAYTVANNNIFVIFSTHRLLPQLPTVRPSCYHTHHSTLFIDYI